MTAPALTAVILLRRAWPTAFGPTRARRLQHSAVQAFEQPETGCITVNVLADGKDLIVSVKGNGLGISGAVLPHIFDLFAQSSSASAGGLSVGLAIVKTVAESHGGTVSAPVPAPVSVAN